VLPEDIVAAFLTSSLALVLVRALYEHRKFHQGKKETAREEAESTANEPLIILSAVFVIIFYLEMASYVILVVAGFQHVLIASYVQLQVPFASSIQTFGVAMMIFGYITIFLSLRALEPDKLATRGPYRYVRHPQYLGYFIVFAGFFLLLQNLVALVPLLSIPGEVRMATIEEGFLTEKFGNSYVDYQKVTGKFLPKIRTKNHTIMNYHTYHQNNPK
jgi:protein-S-isoprenylcysteine O-methyltransferase Ste14